MRALRGERGKLGIKEVGEFFRNYVQGLGLCRGALLKKGHLYKSLYISMGVRQYGDGEYVAEGEYRCRGIRLNGRDHRCCGIRLYIAYTYIYTSRS